MLNTKEINILCLYLEYEIHLRFCVVTFLVCVRTFWFLPEAKKYVVTGLPLTLYLSHQHY